MYNNEIYSGNIESVFRNVHTSIIHNLKQIKICLLLLVYISSNRVSQSYFYNLNIQQKRTNLCTNLCRSMFSMFIVIVNTQRYSKYITFSK